jgi:hypothetical protein
MSTRTQFQPTIPTFLKEMDMTPMQRYLQTTLHPERYHGHAARPPFFEGWYVKLVDATERHRYAVIPGISLSPGGEGPHSFIQVLDGVTGETAYHTYPVTDVWAAEDAFDVRIGPNRFTSDAITLDLPGPALDLRGHVAFRGLTPWPVTLTAPGIMGPFGWIPGMECNHGVVSMDHALEGTLTRGTRRIDVTGGRGYIEKDWGQAFPAAWVWTQTNHFATTGTSLTASIAIIPFGPISFRGFIVGLLHRGVLYRFATYSGATTERLAIEADRVTWVLRSPLYRLRLVAQRAAGGDLRGPSPTDMGRRVPETLQAAVEVRLTARHTDTILFSDTGRHAGLEVVGDVQALTAPF